MRQKNNRIWGLLVGLVIFLSACGGSAGAISTPTPLPPVVNYEKAIFTVERGSIVQDKIVPGEIVPRKQDELFFRAEGYVTRVLYKRGNFVKKGELMAEMQVDDLLNQLAQAQIDLEVAQAALAADELAAKYAVQRGQANVKMWENRVALAELDLQQAFGGDAKKRAQLNLDIARQNLVLAQLDEQQAAETDTTSEKQAVDRTRLAVTRLESLIADRRIIAPYDCIIIKSSANPGVNAQAFNTMFLVGDPTDLVVRAQYNYELREKLTVKTEIGITFSSEDEQPWAVNFLPNFLPVSSLTTEAGAAASSTDYLYFTAPTDAPKEKRVVGQSVNIKIILGRKDDVLLLPPAAIRNYRGLNFVIVLDGDIKRRVEIFEIGLQTVDRWEVSADLKEGDQVLGP